MYKHIFFILLIILTSCHGKQSQKTMFSPIEHLMEEKTDSIYTYLKTIDPDTLPDADKAHYILLCTEAEDKLYIKHTTDSLIAEARAYFKAHSDIPHLAKAWYLTGRIHFDQKQWKLAIQDFLEAKELTEHSDNYALRARIADHIGNLNWKNALYPKAQHYYKKAHQHYKHINDTSGMAHTLKEIGETYMANHQTDSAILFYKQSLSLAEHIDENKLLKDIHNRLGYMYKQTEQYQLAIFHFQKAIHYSDLSPYYIYNNLGALFIQTEQLDSARFYLEKALSATQITTQAITCYYLGELSHLEGKDEDAFYYKKRSEVLEDSIKNQKQTNVINQVQQEREQKNIQREYNKQLLKKNLFIGGLIILICMVFFSLYKVLSIYQEKIKTLLKTINDNNNQTKLLKQLKQTYMERCKEHPFLQKLYSKKNDPLALFTSDDWEELYSVFDTIYPNFRSQLKKHCPNLSVREEQICLLAIMNIKNTKIANITNLQSNSLSSYKQTIKRKYFIGQKSSLEDLLTQFLVDL